MTHTQDKCESKIGLSAFAKALSHESTTDCQNVRVNLGDGRRRDAACLTMPALLADVDIAIDCAPLTRIDWIAARNS